MEENDGMLNRGCGANKAKNIRQMNDERMGDVRTFDVSKLMFLRKISPEIQSQS
jgi:hypothetical protein